MSDNIQYVQYSEYVGHDGDLSLRDFEAIQKASNACYQDAIKRFVEHYNSFPTWDLAVTIARVWEVKKEFSNNIFYATCQAYLMLGKW